MNENVLWQLLADGSLVAVVLVALAPLFVRGPSDLARLAFEPWIFSFLVCITLLVFRLPSITYGSILNADEAQMTAQAITLVHHPIPWRDYDGTTSGPVNTAAVAIPALFGLIPSLQSSRIIGTLLLAGTLLCLYAMNRKLWGEACARIATLLPLAWLCGATDGNYVQYASEIVSDFLIALALACTAYVPAPRGARAFLAAIAGLAMGSIPFAKFQGAPFSPLLAVALAIVIQTRVQRAERMKCWITFVLGVFAVPTLVLGAVLSQGALGDFVQGFVVFPRALLDTNIPHKPGLNFLFPDGPYDAFLVAAATLTILPLAAAFIINRSPMLAIGPKLAATLSYFLIMTSVAIYVIQVPPAPFVHYVLFMLVPVSALCACSLGALLHATAESRLPSWTVPAALIAVTCVSLVPTVHHVIDSGPPFGRDILMPGVPSEPNVAELRAKIKAGQRVAMWGWTPQYLVYTGAVMGTRDSISQFQIEARPFRDAYRARYLADFEANRPDFVLEAVGPKAYDYHNRARQGISSFPQLAGLVARNYTLVLNEPNVRLFERNHLADRDR